MSAKEETCLVCDCATGRAGAGEDSIYDSLDRGPYCEECYGILMGDAERREEKEVSNNQERGLIGQPDAPDLITTLRSELEAANKRAESDYAELRVARRLGLLRSMRVVDRLLRWLRESHKRATDAEKEAREARALALHMDEYGYSTSGELNDEDELIVAMLATAKAERENNTTGPSRCVCMTDYAIDGKPCPVHDNTTEAT